MYSKAFRDIDDPVTRRIIDATLAINPSLLTSNTTTAMLERCCLPIYRTTSAPFFLDTVIVSTHDSLLVFSQGPVGDLQHGSCLILPKTTIIRRFFISLSERLPCTFDTGALDAVMKTASVLGFGRDSVQIFKDALARHTFLGPDPFMSSWNCYRAMVFSDLQRWSCLKDTQGGEAYLARLTHLTVWLDEDSCQGEVNGLPFWVRLIPFGIMKSLTHFACPVARNQTRMTSSRTAEFSFYIAREPGTLHYWLWDRRYYPHESRPSVERRFVTVEEIIASDA